MKRIAWQFLAFCLALAVVVLMTWNFVIGAAVAITLLLVSIQIAVKRTAINE